MESVFIKVCRSSLTIFKFILDSVFFKKKNQPFKNWQPNPFE